MKLSKKGQQIYLFWTNRQKETKFTQLTKYFDVLIANLPNPRLNMFDSLSSNNSLLQIPLG